MGTPTSIHAYGREFDIWNKAAESPRGLEIGPLDRGAALSLRVRLWSARDRRRKENRKVYPEDSPMHGQSPWEHVELKLIGVPGSQPATFLLRLIPRANIELELREL